MHRGLVRMVSISPDMDTSESMPYACSFVFDWSNVLCPSSWLQTISIGAVQDGPEFHLVAASLRQLDMNIVALLTHATRLGAVYVASSHTQQYLEQLCRSLLPQTGQLLFHPCSIVQLVCATSNVVNPTWYAQILQAIYMRARTHDGDICFLAIGHDHTWQSMAQMNKEIVAKRIVISCLEPSLPDCIEILKRLKAMLDDIAFHHGSLNIVV
ncbi:hypothetical protein THRCLA_05692 [Thraustotheca clavata]|uniref:Uncharacterized protein n=1 Tax=Thraustotheca clavata TaxID=74557 RepID=A0A1V9ZV11_9STRA|nr:hypothetical protein THRCLA_05692 [Thraustotheca clavata]